MGDPTGPGVHPPAWDGGRKAKRDEDERIARELKQEKMRVDAEVERDVDTAARAEARSRGHPWNPPYSREELVEITEIVRAARAGTPVELPALLLAALDVRRITRNAVGGEPVTLEHLERFLSHVQANTKPPRHRAGL